MMVNKKAEYYSFLLRMWRVENGEQKRRATLENVESGEKHGFATLAELLKYLEEISLAWDQTSSDSN